MFLWQEEYSDEQCDANRPTDIRKFISCICGKLCNDINKIDFRLSECTGKQMATLTIVQKAHCRNNK